MRDVLQIRREEEKERRKERKARVAYFWGKKTLLSCGAKECLAFDLYSLLKVADAQTSSGTSRIVLAPSAKHTPTRILSGPKIQNQRGILLTIYVGVSLIRTISWIRQGKFATENI